MADCAHDEIRLRVVNRLFPGECRQCKAMLSAAELFAIVMREHQELAARVDALESRTPS